MQESEKEYNTQKRVKLGKGELPALESCEFSEFRLLLDQLQVDSSFLEEDPEYWKFNKWFYNDKKIVQNLPTVNKHVESVVTLIKAFNC